MSQFFLDNFTGSDGSPLSTHTGDSGVTWTRDTTFGTGDPTIRGNMLSGNDNSAYYASASPSTGEYSLSGTIKVQTTDSGRRILIYGRFNRSTLNGYYVEFNINASANIVVTLNKIDSGAGTSLGTYTITAPGVGNSFSFELSLMNAAKKVYIDGVERISHTNNTYTAAESSLVRMFSATAGEGLRLDSFNGTNPSSDLAVTLPIETLSATLAAGVTGSIASSTPMIIGYLGDSSLSGPIPMFLAAMSGATGERGVIMVSLPAPDLAASGAVVGLIAAIPMLQFTGTGMTGSVGTTISTIPLLSLSANLITGVSATIDVGIPIFSCAIYGAASLTASLPVIGITAAGVLGSAATINPSVPVFAMLASGISAYSGNIDISLPPLQFSGTMASGSAGAFSRELASITAVITGTTGTAGTADLILPALIFSGRGYADISGTISAFVPMIFASVTGTVALTASFRTWVLNARKQALTEYSDFPFNSMTTFRGRVLAAGPTGIFELGSHDSDAGAAIDATALTATTDFGSSFNKRIPRIYTGYASSGDMEFHTITSQDGARKYLLSRNGITGIQQRRVPVGRGPKSRYWQFRMSNRDGSPFTIESMLVYPEKNRRRVI